MGFPYTTHLTLRRTIRMLQATLSFSPIDKPQPLQSPNATVWRSGCGVDERRVIRCGIVYLSYLMHTDVPVAPESETFVQIKAMLYLLSVRIRLYQCAQSVGM